MCKLSPDISRHMSSLISPHGKVETYQFVQYRFSGSEHSVDVKPHGNSKKCTRPYKRTCPSTLRELEEVNTHQNVQHLRWSKREEAYLMLHVRVTYHEVRHRLPV